MSVTDSKKGLSVFQCKLLYVRVLHLWLLLIIKMEALDCEIQTSVFKIIQSEHKFCFKTSKRCNGCPDVQPDLHITFFINKPLRKELNVRFCDPFFWGVSSYNLVNIFHISKQLPIDAASYSRRDISATRPPKPKIRLNFLFCLNYLLPFR